MTVISESSKWINDGDSTVLAFERLLKEYGVGPSDSVIGSYR